MVNPAYGPKSKAFLPSMIRVSRCGTDIGGAQRAAFPYTFAACCSMMEGLLQISRCPLTGKPPNHFHSTICDFWRSGSAHPHAPMKTNGVVIVLLLSEFLS